MRDNGPTRNAEYYFNAETHQDSQLSPERYTSLRDSLYSSAGFSKNIGPKARNSNLVSSVINYPNRSMYGFGGVTPMSGVYSRVADNPWLSAAAERDSVTIIPQTNVRLNDYTKNIS